MMLLFQSILWLLIYFIVSTEKKKGKILFINSRKTDSFWYELNTLRVLKFCDHYRIQSQEKNKRLHLFSWRILRNIYDILHWSSTHPYLVITNKWPLKTMAAFLREVEKQFKYHSIYFLREYWKKDNLLNHPINYLLILNSLQGFQIYNLY